MLHICASWGQIPINSKLTRELIKILLHLYNAPLKIPAGKNTNKPFMKSIHRIVFIILFILSTGIVFGQMNKQPFKFDDLQKLVNLSDPKISPGGSRDILIKPFNIFL
jgi:p-aminobenzoyl-glutamate transporter AbgT